MLYLMCDPMVAEDLSRSLMRLLRPSHLRDERFTDLYAEFIFHPETGYAALVLPEDEYIPVHLEADGAELKELLDVFVADEAITKEEAEGIQAGIQAAAGTRVSIVDFIPPSWNQNLLTESEKTANGWG